MNVTVNHWEIEQFAFYERSIITDSVTAVYRSMYLAEILVSDYPLARWAIVNLNHYEVVNPRIEVPRRGPRAPPRARAQSTERGTVRARVAGSAERTRRRDRGGQV